MKLLYWISVHLRQLTISLDAWIEIEAHWDAEIVNMMGEITLKPQEF